MLRATINQHIVSHSPGVLQRLFDASYLCDTWEQPKRGYSPLYLQPVERYAGMMLEPEITPEVFAQYRQEAVDPEDHIVVLCHHGARSLSVAMWLRGQGFDRAQSLAGGIDRWSRTIDSSIPRY